MVPNDLHDHHYRQLQPPPPPVAPPHLTARTAESPSDILAALAAAEAAAVPGPMTAFTNNDHHVQQQQQHQYQYFIPSLPKSQPMIPQLSHLPPYPSFDYSNNNAPSLSPFVMPHSAPPPPLNLPSPTAAMPHLPQSAPPPLPLASPTSNTSPNRIIHVSSTTESNMAINNRDGNNSNTNAHTTALPHSAPPMHPQPTMHSQPLVSLPHRHVAPSSTIERGSANTAIFDKFFPMSSPTTTIASVTPPTASPTFPGAISSLPLLPSTSPKATLHPPPKPVSTAQHVQPIPMKRKRTSSTPGVGVAGGVCTECGKCFFKSGALARHMKSSHPNSLLLSLPINSSGSIGATQKSAPVERLDCPRCDKTFSQQGSLNRHLRSIHEARKLHCRYCSLAFGQAFDLKRHQRRKHPGRATAVPTQALPAIVIRGGRAHADNRS